MTEADKNAKFLADSYLKIFKALKSLDKAIGLGVESVNITDDILKTNQDKQWIDKCLNMLSWAMHNIRVEFDGFTQLLGNPDSIAIEHNSSMGELQQAINLFKDELKRLLNA